MPGPPQRRLTDAERRRLDAAQRRVDEALEGVAEARRAWAETVRQLGIAAVARELQITSQALSERVSKTLRR